MGGRKDSWLEEFARDAVKTDVFARQPDHVELIALGMAGEAGSVLAEVKKRRREGRVYLFQRARIREELGDFLWYYTVLVTLVAPSLLKEIGRELRGLGPETKMGDMELLLGFGAIVGDALGTVRHGSVSPRSEAKRALSQLWDAVLAVSRITGVPLREAAAHNERKRANRWSPDPKALPVFDEGFPDEERLPPRLVVEFLQRGTAKRPVVTIRCNGLNIGDQLTDNIDDADEYRFHDIFHLGNAAMLGWSPVTRGLLGCKRRSIPNIDENQDGGRATVVEEAITAFVFGRAKQLDYFEGIDQLDYDLLKTIKELVRGYEVETVPLWQWENSILESYKVFRKLRLAGGGRVLLDLRHRRFAYLGPPAKQRKSRRQSGVRAQNRK